MSYALSEALQRALYQRLGTDAGLAALVGSAIYDSIPAGTVPDLYVVIGAEAVRDKSDVSGAGAEHDVTISVHCRAGGFGAAKAAGVAVSDALAAGGMTLDRGTLIAVWFLKARAVRDGQARRIDLIFRARVEDS